MTKITLNSLDSKINTIDSKIDNLILFLGDKFDDIQEKFNGINNRLVNLENGQDHILGELKTLNEDKKVGAYRSRRMESWIEKAAKKINTPYNP